MNKSLTNQLFQPKVSSNFIFIIPLAFSFYFQIYFHAFLIFLVILTSIFYHLSNEKNFRLLDPFTSYALIAGNFYLCFIFKFNPTYFLPATIAVFLGFYFFFKAQKENYNLNHGLWHFFCAVITLFCIFGYQNLFT